MGGGDVMTDVFPRAHDARGSENDEVRRGERRATRSRWRWENALRRRSRAVKGAKGARTRGKRAKTKKGGLSRDARATGRRRGRRAGATWILSERAD